MNTSRTLLTLAIFAIFTISEISAHAQPTNSFDAFVDSNIGIKAQGEFGWLPVNDKAGNDAFYYYVKNQAADANAPLFILVPSGSGKSILTSYFTSWGPQIFKFSSNSLQTNHHAYNKYADLLMVDVPIGTGFSRYSDVSQIPNSPKQKVAQFHKFINNFFDKHGDLMKREIYLVSELRGTQMTPLYALKMVKSGIDVKGLISFSNLSNPWLDHLSYAPNMEYKRIVKKSSKMYKSLAKSAKFCNLFSVLGSPNAEHYCTSLNDTADVHALDIFTGGGVQDKYDPNTRCRRIERKVERWINTERVQKYFGVKQKFWNVNPQVFNAETQGEHRIIATDAVVTALLNRGVEVNIIVGSLQRTANWIGNLMAATRFRWYGQKKFVDAKWTLWNRKNDLKQTEGLNFARVFGRSYNFWQTDAIEATMFINEYILKKHPTRAEEYPAEFKHANEAPKVKGKKSIISAKMVSQEDQVFKKIEAQNEQIKKMQGELMEETKVLKKAAVQETS